MQSDVSRHLEMRYWLEAVPRKGRYGSGQARRPKDEKDAYIQEAQTWRKLTPQETPHKQHPQYPKQKNGHHPEIGTPIDDEEHDPCLDIE